MNPNTGTGEELSGASGLDRMINISSSNIIRKFYIPQYLGTVNSYESSVGVTTYQVLFEIAQNSYFYRKKFGTAEQVEVLGTIYITTSKTPGPGPGPGPDPDPPTPVPEPVISTLDELRAKLKIRLK